VGSARGSLKLSPQARREVFGYTALSLQATLDGARLDATLDAALAEGGRVTASLRSGLDPASTMAGQLVLDVRDLAWLELFSPDLATPVGRLQGRLALAGSRAAPEISGQARLGGFAAELPGLGLKLADGEFTLVGDVDGSARLDGSLRSGDGLLRFDGSLNFRDREAPLQLVLQGERVTLASTAEFYVIASPDLTLRLHDQQLEVRGRLDVPEARLDLEALDTSATVSDDVVVLDPVDGPRERALPRDLRFTVALGDDVRLKGFGLDGRIRGSLALRERPGRPATATGTLDVSGSYQAYGQSLQIQRARLGYANSPYDNPTLDIRAERDFDRVTVGVQVRGTARRPQTTVVSNPAMDTSEALSWLVFGRPLSTTTGNEGQQLNAAAMALGAGGNLVAQQIGAQLGLDEAGVTDSRNLGGATFTVGKYVSPRLFLSYGVSLIGTGQVVTLKYLLTRGFDVSIESGNENAASLNWRLER
jgi:translocation and assembly module TamB